MFRPLPWAVAALSAAAFAQSGAGPDSWVGDLAPISAADWNYDRAAHLLERAGFGGTPAEIRALASMTPQEAVRHLVHYQTVKDVDLPPFQETGIYPSPDWTRFALVRAFSQILYSTLDSLPPAQRAAAMDDQLTGVTPEEKRIAKTDKQAVVDEFYLTRNLDQLETARLATWIADRMVKTQRPLQEKLVLFWHGHFASGNEKMRDYRMMINQFSMLRENANGRLRDLLIGIGKDPAMLIYLDNNQNVKGHPNENFAREVMELFSLGVGNYTEKDIQEAARAFTGWTLTPTGKYIYRPELHDDGQKTVLGKTGNFKGEDVVDILLKQNAASHFIARKLYKFFGRDSFAPEFEDKMATLLKSNGYSIGPFLETMFLSKDFYSPATVATQIKSPVQLVISTYRKLGTPEAATYPKFAGLTANLGQSIFYPPNVKGWDGGRTWINPATMFERANVARYILFPEEMPVPKAPHLENTRRLSGDFIHNQFLAMAEKGNFTDFPGTGMASASMGGPNKGMGGSTDTMRLQAEDFNLFRGVFNAGWWAVERVPPEPRKVPAFSVTAILRAEHITTASGGVDALLRRFLRAPITGERRAEIVRFCEKQTGGENLDFTRVSLEKDLREVLHLIMSTPEYQLS